MLAPDNRTGHTPCLRKGRALAATQLSVAGEAKRYTFNTTRGKMGTSVFIVMIVLSIVCLPAVSKASDFDLAAWYGGSSFSSKATIESEKKTGSVGGSHLVGVNMAGPAIAREIRPLVSYEYHWSGDGNDSYIRTQSDILSFGFLRASKWGYAEVNYSICATHFSDTYDVFDSRDNRVDHTMNNWGLTIGLDLRFKFFDNIDSVVGYKCHWREQLVIESDGVPSENSYVIEGREADHCIFAGMTIGLGDV